MDEDTLITEFRKHQSEDAFAALVSRHVDLVYAVALRQVGDPGAAEEIAQNVFVSLARKAHSLGGHRTVAGWVYRATLHEARQWMRAELRRQRREQTAADLHVEASQGESVWKPLVALLDEGLQTIEEPDRTAVLLHCLEGRPFREVGAALGVGEDAARKRVDRALETLTSFFRNHGFAIPTVTTSVPLFALATLTAPPALSATVTAAATGAIPTSLTAGVLMSSTKIKLGLAVLVAAAVATPLLLQQAAIGRLQNEIRSLRTQNSEVDRLRRENNRLAVGYVDANELARLRQGYWELARLRAEVSRLRNQHTPAINAVGQPPEPETLLPEVPAAPSPSFRAQLQALVPSGNTLVTGGWSTAPGKRSLVLVTPVLAGQTDGGVTITIRSTFVEGPEEVLARMGLGVAFSSSNSTSTGFVLDANTADRLARELTEAEGITLLAAPSVSTADGRQAQVQIVNFAPSGPNQWAGAAVDLIPHVSPQGDAVDLFVLAELPMRAGPTSSASNTHP